jgi:hypothetical protein
MDYFKPTHIKKEKVKNFLKLNRPIFVDAFVSQVKELFLIDSHEFIGQDKEKIYKTSQFKKYVANLKDDFNFFYYPWCNTLVKCIGGKDYFRLKTNRNQDLITVNEQKKLANFKVAVFGMSVGSNIAFVLTQAGIGKKIVIADYDSLETTNLNRILAGVYQIGLNKAIIAARRIYEDNPYAQVTIYPDGVTEKSVEDLFKRREVNCLVEEIDNIGLKIRIRILAIKYKIPILMITDNGEGVVLSVERYDLGYSKIFGHDKEYWKKKITGPLTKAEAGAIIINDIVGGKDKVDPKMLASVKKVLAWELVSWPQLGSSAILGGVACTIALKKLVLTKEKKLFKKIFINLAV